MGKTLTAIVICVFLTGCTLMPGYHRPSLPTSSSWPNGRAYEEGKTHSTGAAIGIGWAEFFNDPRLHKLIELALNNNRDLRLAALNVELLRAQYQIGLSLAFPTIDGLGTGVRQRDLAVGGVPQTTGKYTLKLGVTSYELDLFGRIRSLKAQALEQYFASEENRRSVQISLVAEVGTQYLMERALQEQLTETQQTLKSVEANYKLIKGSYDYGNASALDLQSAQAQVQTAKANMFNYIRQHAQAQDALVLLIGEPIPNDLPEAESFNSQKILIDIPEGVPSDLLERRPDILEAEHQLKAANANIGAARAAFFPKILLTGAGGIASVKLTDLFTGDAVWNFSPQITMPIFDAGANKASLDAAKISRSIQVAQYEKVIQTAFQEVSDALTGRATYDDQVQAQEALVKALQQRYDLANLRYKNGVDNYLTVLTAQQDLYTAQQNLIQVQFGKLSNLITLYKALGGGWQEYVKK